MRPDERLSDLASRLWEADGLSPEEERELGEALRESPDARRLLLSYFKLEGAIVEQARAALLSGPQALRPAATLRKASTRAASRLPWAVGLAAAGFVIAVILLAHGGAPPPTRASLARSPAVRPSLTPAPAEPPRIPEPPKSAPGLERPPASPDGRRPTPAPEPVVPPAAAPEETPVAEPALAAKPADERDAIVAEVVIERAEGEVFLSGAGARNPGRAGDPIRPGQTLETGGGKSLAVFTFPDGTRVEARPGTLLREIGEKGASGGKAGKSLSIQHGSLWAHVRPQPTDRPLVVQFPRGEARVLGTVFTLQVDVDPKGLTRLDVQEGKVRFTRSADNRSVDVPAGSSASSGQGADLLVLRSQEVVLSFQDGLFPAPDYAGTRDTTLAEKSPQANYGASRTLAVEAEDPREKRKASWSLLRWDLTSVPPGSLVRSAQVTLHVLEPSHGQAFFFFEPSRSWSEKEAGWKFASSGAVWRFPGSLGAVERWPAPLGTLTPLQKGEYTVVLADAGVALVQTWVNAPATNLGLELASALPGAGLRLSSREALLPEHRPRLTVVTTPKK